MAQINNKSMDIINYYPDEIAETLCNLAFEETAEETLKEVEEAIHQLKATAENEYNADCFRTLYRVLETIADREDIPRF